MSLWQPCCTKIVKEQGTWTPGRARHNAQKYSGVLEQPWNSHPSRCPKRDRYAARRGGTKHQVSQENRTHCRQGAEAASVIHIIGNTGKKKHTQRKHKNLPLLSSFRKDTANRDLEGPPFCAQDLVLGVYRGTDIVTSRNRIFAFSSFNQIRSWVYIFTVF